MKWPAADQLSAMMPLPDGYRLERFDRADVAPLIAAVRTWHPEISVGANSCYLREDFYRNRVSFDAGAERDVWVAVIRHKGELAGMWSVERETDSLAIYGRLFVLAPAHRGANLSVHIMAGSETIGRAMGAEFLYAMATLKFPNVQRALERAGYQLLGFLPGYDREEVAPGVVKRVYQAVYAKLLVPGEHVLRPDPKNLTPMATRLFELLFPIP